MAVNATRRTMRNFGPRLDLILLPDKVLPAFTRTPIHGFYAVIGLILARKNIRHSREYLLAVTGRPAGILTVWRHYRRLIASLHRKLRVSAGEASDLHIVDSKETGGFAGLTASGEPALFGTFHVGDSDLLGFMLAEKYGRRLAMVRLRVGNSSDTDRLAERFSARVKFLWVDRPEDTLIRLKESVMSGDSIALQCDRSEHGARAEAFPFLGARRLFPFSIYHLAILFGRPVIFAFALRTPEGESRVTVSGVFRADPAKSRAENLDTARAHFRAVLAALEHELRANPLEWFNFTPLNPPVA